MKRKLFMTIIAVLIVCLTCGMLLVACNKGGTGSGGDEKPPVPETRPESSVTMLNSVWNQIASSINVGEGKKFVADFDIALNIDDETEANNDVVYSLIGKASVDVNAGQESDIYIELKETKNGESRILFGFAYDVETVGDVATPYIYVNVADGGYRKINGFSLTELVAAIVAAQPAEATAAGVDFGQILENLKEDPTTIFPVLVELVGLIDSEGTISDYGKTFNFNVNFDKLFSFLGTALTDEILAGIGISAEQSAAIAQQVGAILGFENVENIGGLCKAVADALMFVNCELVFRFDDEQLFQSAEIKVDYNKNVENVPENVANYTVSVNKARIDLGSLDVFAGSAITEEVRAQEAINLLNFSLKGSAVSYKGEEIAHRYTIEVQSDINPFELLSLIGDTSKENIVATLKKLGYFHLEINEVNENGDKVTNIITLHSKFDEGFAVANLNLNDAKVILSLPIGLGGVYDFGGLVDVIGMLTAGNAEATSAAGTDIFGMIFQMLGFFHADNIATDGVTVDIKDLVVTLVESLGMTLDDTLSDVLNQVLDCDSINIKLETPTYGTCTTVDTATIESGIRTASTFKTGKDFIKEIVSLDGFSTEILQNDANLARYINGTLEAGKCFEMTGINLKGENVKTSGFIMAAEGLDVTKAGEQEVTFYIAVGTDIIATLDTASMVADIAVPDNIPINGVLVYNTKVNVIPYNAEATVAFDNLAESKEIKLGTASGKTWFGKIKTKSYSDLIMNITETVGEEQITRSYVLEETDAIVTRDGKDVTAEVIANGMSVAGTYKVTAGIGGYKTEEFTFLVDDAYLELTSEGEVPASIELGEVFAIPTYKVVICNPDGTTEEKTVEPVYKLGYTAMDLEDLFDIKDGVYTLKKNLDYVGKNFTIVYTVTLPSGNKDLKVEIPITGPALTKGSTVYFGNSMNNYFGITFGDVTYSFVYENGKWIAKSADGQTKELDITFEWTSAGSGDFVTFNDGGYISNYNVSDTKTSGKVCYAFTIDGYTYSGSFTAYELYATNKTGSYSAIDLNEKLDGFINYIDKIYYEVDGEVKALEFKYGTAGYGLYVKGTDTKVYNVKVTVFNGEEDVTSTVLVDGAMTQSGTFKVQYEIDAIYGTAFTISHNVEVKA